MDPEGGVSSDYYWDESVEGGYWAPTSFTKEFLLGLAASQFCSIFDFVKLSATCRLLSEIQVASEAEQLALAEKIVASASLTATTNFGTILQHVSGAVPGTVPGVSIGVAPEQGGYNDYSNDAWETYDQQEGEDQNYDEGYQQDYEYGPDGRQQWQDDGTSTWDGAAPYDPSVAYEGRHDVQVPEVAGDWVPVFDDQAGAYYYANQTTGETSWYPPPGV